MPLYIQFFLKHPAELLAVRIVSSVVFLAVVLAVARRLPEFFLAFRRPVVRRNLLITTFVVGLNWFVYFYSFTVKRTMDASLGYFMQPLLNAFIGAVWFREHFRPAQIVATAIAAIGLIVLVALAGEWPWIAVTLAISFGTYTTIRKVTPVDGLVGLSVEVVLLSPIAIAYLFWIWHTGMMSFGTIDRTYDGWMLASGLITAIPMVCFGQAARRLKISTLGFLQYISPMMQFIIALTLFNEKFDQTKFIGYLIVWFALAIFIFDSLIVIRNRRRAASTVLVN